MMVPTVEFVDEILVCDHSTKGSEQDVRLPLFIALYRVVLTLASVNEVLTA